MTRLADGRWLALVSARRLGEGPGSPMVLVRTWSRDEGRTWTKPEQLTVGAWPCVTAIDERTSFCAFTCYAAWGDMRVLFSDDGFNTFFQERPVVQRCWLDGMTYRTSEVPPPPPPLVPYLADNWPYEHYGFASSAALGADRVAVAVSRTQRGTIYWDYTGLGNKYDLALDVPPEQERIDIVIYAREPVQVQSDAAHPSSPKGRWVLTKRFQTANFTSVTQLPSKDLMGCPGERCSDPPMRGLPGRSCLESIFRAAYSARCAPGDGWRPGHDGSDSRYTPRHRSWRFEADIRS